MPAQISTIDHELSFVLADKPVLQLIGDRLIAGATTIPVIDPGTGAQIATAPVADASQLDNAVAAARRALPGWGALSADERGRVIGRIADVIDEHREDLARLTTLEQGKPLSEARDDVQWSIDFARYFAEYRLEREVVRDTPDSLVEIQRRPVGVIGAICPWNFPLFQAVYKLAPALAAGNTMVLKPSPTTPLATMYFAELLQNVVPAGVLNVIGDDGSVGQLLTAHPGVDKISFTGSTVTGRKVMSGCGPSLKRLTLELGGNDAAVVLDDVDISEAAKGLFTWAFANGGQVCVSIKRIYAPESIYDLLCNEIARLANELTVGHGLADGTELGPVQNAAQYEKCVSYLELAAQHGTVIAGGTLLDRPGYYVAPTVVRDITEDSPLVSEETFGPIRSIMSYKTVDEAIERANNSPYGLGSSIWSSDLERAAALAPRLEAGTTWVNHHFALTPDVPFGGIKQSGLGVEFGRAGFEEFTEPHVVNIRRR